MKYEMKFLFKKLLNLFIADVKVIDKYDKKGRRSYIYFICSTCFVGSKRQNYSRQSYISSIHIFLSMDFY